MDFNTSLHSNKHAYFNASLIVFSNASRSFSSNGLIGMLYFSSTSFSFAMSSSSDS